MFGSSGKISIETVAVLSQLTIEINHRTKSAEKDSLNNQSSTILSISHASGTAHTYQ
jgi:hypothetical protein